MPFHDCIGRRNGGKVFINPRMVIEWHHHWSHNGKRACARECGGGGGGGGGMGHRLLGGSGIGGHQLPSREYTDMRRRIGRLGAGGGKLRRSAGSCQCPRLFSNGTADPPGQEVVFQIS